MTNLLNSASSLKRCRIKKIFKLILKRRLKFLLVFLVAALILFSTFSFGYGQEEETSKISKAEEASSPIYTALGYVLYALLWVIGWFLALCARLLNATLDPALYNFTTEGIVQEGWRIVRDVCNLLFVLILLIIAFATILRLETYDIKRMLPKLLVVALLINFSKMIAGLIIDASQILMNTFLNAMDGPGLSAFVANQTNVIENLKVELPGVWEALGGTHASLSTIGNISLAIIFFLVMGVIFLILGVLLLIRIIALWILIIPAPLALLIGIIPTGKKFADQWWENFIKYCFFGPIMAFFLYLSYHSMSNIKKFTAATEATGELGFLTRTGHDFLVYVTIMVLLIASVIVAKSLGIAGAKFMVSGAKGLAGWGAKTITAMPARKARRAARKAGVAAGAAVLSKIPGFKGVARRMRAKEKAVRQAEAMKQYAPAYKAMSDKDLMEEADRALGEKRAVAAMTAADRGLGREVKPERAAKWKTTLERFGFEEEARALEEQQPDIAGKAEDVDEVIERIGISGVQKLTGEALTPKVMQAITRQLSTSEFANVFRKWAKDTRSQAEKTMREVFTTPAGEIDVEIRKRYARATGKVAEAFKEPEAQEEAKNYILSLKGEHFGKLKTAEDWKMAGQYMGPGQVAAAGLDLSEEQKNEMRVIAEGVNPKAAKAMYKADTWAT